MTRGSSYVWSATDTTTATGTFATLIFSVSEDASAGTYPVTITCVEAYNSESDVSVNIQNGSVIVNAEECVHDMESISYKEPTCETAGSRILKCTKCGYSETVTFDKIDCVAENEADCINDAECKYCGDVLESAYGHKYRTQVIDPTTTDEGYTLYTCMRCGDSYQDTILPPVNDNIPVTGIILNASSVTLKIGETDSKLLKATIEPSDATNQTIIWVSSNPSVAKINISVNKMYADIIALAEGTTTITATTEDGSFVAQCVVTVIEPETDNIPVTGITLSESTVTVKVGDGKFVDATVLPDNATNKLVNWTCSDPTIADIAWSGDNNSRGLIVGRAAGTATITATTADGNFIATCVVIVTEVEKTIVEYKWYSGDLRHKVIYSDGSYEMEDCAPVDCVCGRQYDDDLDAPTICIDNVTSSAGKTVEVNIALKNNPGIASMKLKVSYDEAVLSLQNIRYNSSIGGQSQQPQTMASPVTLNWYNGGANSEGDFVYATLVFLVKNTASAGTSSITVTYDPEDVYNLDYTNIDFAIQNGQIDIVDHIPGDISGDGSVNNKD